MSPRVKLTKVGTELLKRMVLFWSRRTMASALREGKKGRKSASEFKKKIRRQRREGGENEPRANQRRVHSDSDVETDSSLNGNVGRGVSSARPGSSRRGGGDGSSVGSGRGLDPSSSSSSSSSSRLGRRLNSRRGVGRRRSRGSSSSIGGRILVLLRKLVAPRKRIVVLVDVRVLGLGGSG